MNSSSTPPSADTPERGRPERGGDARFFDWHSPTRVIFGAGTLDRLGASARELGSHRPLLVTDRGIMQAGHVDRAIASLREAGLSPIIFDQVEENPTTRHVAEGLELARRESIDLFIGLGGGSSMDTAKGINFLLTNGGEMADYWGIGKATRPMLPLIAIPTTAGTGSEAQSFALIADDKTHQKMACGDSKAAAQVAILDPAITVSQPARVTAVSGIDAISHAVESYVTRVRHPLSMMFARQAWKLVFDGFPRVLANPTDIEARGLMSLGANLAGSAIEASMLGATHAAANPLSARFDLTHGIAIAILLPHVVRFNAEVMDDSYAELWAETGLPSPGAGNAGKALADWLEKITRLAKLPTSLKETGIDPALIPELAQQAAAQWTGRYNPRSVAPSDFEKIYHLAYNGTC
jgi:alcohol dehydrogenase